MAPQAGGGGKDIIYLLSSLCNLARYGALGMGWDQGPLSEVHPQNCVSVLLYVCFCVQINVEAGT